MQQFITTSSHKIESKLCVESMKYPKLENHIFVCLNERPEGHLRGCCKAKGAEEVLMAFKEQVVKNNLKAKVRAQKAGCLDVCEAGVSVVIYPEGVWYQGVQKADVEEIMQKHIIQGERVERLLMKAKMD